MKWHRLLLAHLSIAMIAGGMLYEIVTDGDHWPFYSFKMFSHYLRDYDMNWDILVGVTDEARSREIVLIPDKYFGFLDWSRLNDIFRKTYPLPDHEQRLQQDLHFLLSYYEKLRCDEFHHGPRLSSMKIYRFHWRLDGTEISSKEPYARELMFTLLK